MYECQVYIHTIMITNCCIGGKNYMSMWQYSPLNPSAHTHVNPATSSCEDKFRVGGRRERGEGG